MPKEIIFEELGKKERISLLRAFDYDVDKEGYIKSPSGIRIQSEETPCNFIHVEDSALVPGTLKVIEGAPTAISKFIREMVER